MSSAVVDKDEVVLLVRSVVAAKKNSITLKELTGDYYECNGTGIPFRQLGFPTLIDFLQSQPDKFVVQRTPTDVTVRAVVDSSIGQICRLVQGQKSHKKKSKAAKPAKSSYFHNHYHHHNYAGSHGFKKNQVANNFNRYSSASASGYQQQSYQRSSFGHFAPPHQHQQQQSRPFTPPHARPPVQPQQQQQAPVNKRAPLKTVSENVSYQTGSLSRFGGEHKASNRSLASGGAGGGRSSRSEHGGSMTSLVLKKELIGDEDRWVNAAYYLREHPVVVTCVLSCDQICLRLKGAQFSESYAQLKKNMDQFYRTNAPNPTLLQPVLEKDTICVASDKNRTSFYRVQIVDKEAPDVYSCHFVDEGVTRNLRSTSLFRMQEQFTHLKFQAVKVCLTFGCNVGDNVYVKERLTQLLLNKDFVARRVSNEPLTVSLYAGDKCVSDTFFEEHRHFWLFKPVQSDYFHTVLTYIDTDSALSYLEVPNVKRERFDELMSDVNDYFNSANNAVESAAFRKEFSLERDANSLVCCAKYAQDSIWYRVKVLRLCAGEKYMAYFIDFGNREPIAISDFRLIPETMKEFKYMPPQALPVSIVSNQNFNTCDLEKLYSRCTLYVRVLHINAAGLPSVEIIMASELFEAPSPPPPPQPTPQGGQISAELANKLSCIEKQMGNLKLAPMEHIGSDDPVKNKKYRDMITPDLPTGTCVFVTSVNNPFDFVINLDIFKDLFKELQVQMKEFYSANKDGLKASDLETDTIYVYCDEKNDCRRVKFLGFVQEAAGKAKVQDIDNGFFDGVSANQIYYITRRFLEMQPQAIKCRMTNLSFNMYGTWTEAAIAVFKELTLGKTFKASIMNYDCFNDYFKIELSAVNDPSLMVSNQFLQRLSK